MRYFTKEWYNDTLIADMCFQLRKNESASEFSEKFFERLYAVEERAYTKYCKRNARASKMPYDKNAALQEFAENYKENLEFIKANLPSEILDDVKDERVLALGTATHDIAMRITRFCGKKNRLCEAAEREYNNASEEADEKIGGEAARLVITLVGAKIISLENNGENAILNFIPAQSLDAKALILKNARIKETDRDLAESTIIKYELLMAEEGGFEFSLLTLAKDSSLLTVSYTASELEA